MVFIDFFVYLQRKMNVFIKPNEQSEACFYSAMARKGAIY